MAHVWICQKQEKLNLLQLLSENNNNHGLTPQCKLDSQHWMLKQSRGHQHRNSKQQLGFITVYTGQFSSYC